MWTIFVGNSLSALMIAGCIFAVEQWRLASAHHLLEQGRAFEAYTLLVKLGASNLMFLDRRAIELHREAAAHAAVSTAVAEHRFERAHALAHAIASDPESGFEADAQRSLAEMPEHHLAYVAAELSSGNAGAAVREARSMMALYPEDARWIGRARSLEARGLVALVRKSLTDGDVDGAVSLMSSVSEELPLSARAELRTLLTEALLHAADGFGRDGGRYAALYRFFEASRERVSRHEGLTMALDETFASVTERLFDIPFRPRGLRAVNAPPMAVSINSTKTTTAVLWLRNETGQSLTVVLRGHDRYRTTLPARSRGRLDIAPGEYVQVAYGAIDAQPFVGVVTLDGQREQIFAMVRPSDRSGN